MHNPTWRYPHNVGLAAACDPDLIARIARSTARVETPFRPMAEGAVRFSPAGVELALVADIASPCP